MDWTTNELARMIDHSLLHPMLTDEMLVKGMALAVEWNCASVCIKPYFLAIAAKLLAGTGVRAGTVISFPHGSDTIESKLNEARQAVCEGAEELDMVINIGKACSEEWSYVRDEILAVNAVVTGGGAILKVIFENDFLSDAQIQKMCEICNEIQPAYIKTSTGFGFTQQESGDYNYDGATVEHIALMRRLADPEIGVKAAGKIRTLDDLLAARKFGATRIGTASTGLILEEALKREEARLA